MDDVLLRWNTTPLLSAESFEDLVEKSASGSQVILKIQREITHTAGVSTDALAQATAGACEIHPRLDVTRESDAEYELVTEAVPTEKGCMLRLSLICRRSGRAVAEGETFFKTKVSLSELGFKSAISATLPAPPHFEAARQALQQRIGLVYDAGSAEAEHCIYISEPGAEERGTWLFPSGRIIVAHSADFSASRRMGELQSNWQAVAAALAMVSASIHEDEIAAHFRQSVEFFTERPRQYQFLLASGGSGKWVLDWPDAYSAWAGLTAGPACRSPLLRLEVKIAGRTLPSNNGWTIYDLSGLRFGSYQFDVSDMLGLAAYWLRIDAFFPQGDGRIALRDQEGAPVTDRELFSAELGSLYVPASEAYCEFR